MRFVYFRLKACLVLFPAVLLLLVFVARFAGEESIIRIGVWEFMGWAVACSLTISYVVTLYVEFVSARDKP